MRFSRLRAATSVSHPASETAKRCFLSLRERAGVRGKGAQESRQVPVWRRAFCILALPVVLITLCLGFSASTHAAENLTLREYEIKAAYLYNFIKYIDWPAQAFPPDSQTITIGVIGENPFGPALATLNGKMVKDRKVVVKEGTTVKDLADCQVVFISASESSRL